MQFNPFFVDMFYEKDCVCQYPSVRLKMICTELIQARVRRSGLFDRALLEDLHQNNTTQHNTRQDKTKKTRHDTTRQKKPSAFPLPPLPPREQDRLHLCTLFTFSLQTFHKRAYACLSSTDTFTYPVCALCTML